MLRRCDFCHTLKLHLEERTVYDSPGGGYTCHICRPCLASGRLPKNFNERMGITTGLKDGAKFLRYIGIPQVTASEYGDNAFGSILAEYDDGSRIGVICGHGGSAWLCLKCAEDTYRQMLKEG